MAGLALGQTECQSSPMDQHRTAGQARGGDVASGFSLGPWRAVADGVLVCVAEPEAVNVGLVLGRTGALLR